MIAVSEGDSKKLENEIRPLRAIARMLLNISGHTSSCLEYGEKYEKKHTMLSS